jgi:hypothetical protein
MSSVFRDKSHLMQLIRNHTGIYSIKLPLSLDELYDAVIKIDTIPTFSTYFPLVKKLPVDLNQIRVANDREAFASDVSDIYEIPEIFPKDSGRFIVGIEKITWFNDMRYQALQSTYETIESYQALAVAQGAANLASVIEPPFITEFIPPNRFRVSNGCYYKDRVVLHIECSYSPELFDLPETKRGAFYKLALLDVKRFLYANLRRWNTVRTAIAEMNLNIDDWQSAEADREQLLEKYDNDAALDRLACVWF